MKADCYPIPRAFCGAKTRTGGTCMQPAMKNGKCRLHGGKSLSGVAHGRYKHGRFTNAAMEERRRLAELLREVKETMNLCATGQRITEEIEQSATVKGHHTLSKIILKGKESLL